MTNVEQPVVCDGDGYFQDPAGFFARLRESGPVAEAWMPHYGRVWVVTGYAEARAALVDPRLAKDVGRWPGGGRTRPSLATGVEEHMLHRDPPDHTRLRRLGQKAFTPRRAAMRPRAQAIAAGLLDELDERVGDGDVVDLLAGYARPLPIAVICELLGVPAADREWLRDTVYAYDDAAQHERVERDLAACFTGLIAAKRSDPGDDLVSALVQAREDGDGLSPAELLAMVYLLVMAGFDTTVNLIASGTLALLTHPGELARLRADPALLPAAVEELLRFTSPVNHANDRFTTEAVPLGGVAIPAGEWVFVALSAAGRDPARYPAPDRLDLGRDTSGHVAFGHGVHHCLGAPLARMEAEVALGALLPRYPELALAVPGQDLRWRPVSLMNGLESLPVRLTGSDRA
ncbi:MAG TPA: cytochrome P450 [Streptosporangiaceae bacterium]|nr:cytochrome P450 [Streptosporangiaceae bacterium]